MNQSDRLAVMALAGYALMKKVEKDASDELRREIKDAAEPVTIEVAMAQIKHLPAFEKVCLDQNGDVDPDKTSEFLNSQGTPLTLSILMNLVEHFSAAVIKADRVADMGEFLPEFLWEGDERDAIMCTNNPDRNPDEKFAQLVCALHE